MPSLTINEVNLFCPFKTHIFVETGTFMGDTINNVKENYEKIYSIELNKSYAEKASYRFINNKNIYILQGDSSELLEPICKSIDKAAFFWLDGHWSGGDTARGKKDCPLIEELNQIMKNCKPMCVIAIDDARLFGTHNNEDWSYITRESIIEKVKDRLNEVKYYPSNLYSEDRMVLVLREII